MPRSGKRVRVSKGIYRDGSGGGFEVRVTVGGTAYSSRMPADSTIEELKRTRANLASTGHTETPRAARGTLRADVPRYLTQVAHLATAKDREDHLQAWLALYGDVQRHRITPADVAHARVLWLTEGRREPSTAKARRRTHTGPLSPKTINHYTDTLRHLYHVLDGKRAPTPCDEIDHLPVTRTPIERVPEAVMIAVDQRLQAFEASGRLRDSKQRARFRVLVSTGKRHIELMRAKPGDVNLEQRVWIPRDGKGGYTPGVYLNGDQLKAWALFIQADAWGPFSHGSFARLMREAGWPEGIRLYQARHSTWIAASERGVDLADISAGAGHTDIRTTRRAYVPILNSRLQRMSETMDGRFNGWESVVPESGPAQKRRKAK